MTNLMKKVVAITPWSGRRKPLSNDLAEFKFSFVDSRWGGLAPECIYLHHRQLFEIAFFLGHQKVSSKTAVFSVRIDIFFDLH
jgi:hypothetical protein